MLTLRSLPLRSLAYHWRGNLAVMLGVAIGTAVLAGALFVGDSLRGSLRAKAEKQLNGIDASLTSAKLIREEVASRLPGKAIPSLMLQGSLTTTSNIDAIQLPRITVIGVDDNSLSFFGIETPNGWSSGKPLAIVSDEVATRLQAKIGDKLRLSVQQFSSVPRSSILGRRGADDVSTTLPITVAQVLPATHHANAFSLLPNPSVPLNVFVPLAFLQETLKQKGKINAIFAAGATTEELNGDFDTMLSLEDLGIRVEVPKFRNAYVSVEADQLILDSSAVEAAEKAATELKLPFERTTVYLANGIGDGKKTIPYSIVAALNAGAAAPLGPFLPHGVTTLKDDEIVLADWDESPLKLTPIGSSITLGFFLPEIEAGAVETVASFRLVGRVPMTDAARDPDLTPPFPGITDKLRMGEWKPPFPYDSTRIKTGDANDRYWNKHKTTPKAYIAQNAGERLFRSRFGTVTSIRISPATNTSPDDTALAVRAAMRKHLSPAKLGLQFDPTRERLLVASRGGTDFGGLFLGFSLFLIVSALILVGLMFRLNIERRAKEIGSLLAAGYPQKTIRRMFLFEGLCLSVVGAILGILVAVAYSRWLVSILIDLWPDSTVKNYLTPYATIASAVIGVSLTILMSLIAIWFAIRGLVKIAPPALLRGETSEPVDFRHERDNRRRYAWLAVVAFVLGVILLSVGTTIANPDFRAMSFFGGGGTIFLAGLTIIHRLLKSPHRSFPQSTGTMGLLALGPRNASRFSGRSLLTIFLIGSATFLLVAVESFRRKPDRDFANKNGGSGGFNLVGEVDIPLFQPLTSKAGRDEILDELQRNYQEQVAVNPTGPSVDARLKQAEATLAKIANVVPLHLRVGDDASCLNLYQAGKPRLLGVPDALIERGGFQFAQTEAVTAEEKANPWLLLKKQRMDGAVPVFGEQNTVMWMLKTSVGGTVETTDEAGRTVKCRIVGTLQDSAFQSELIMADDSFRRLFPREEGFRVLLIETAADDEKAVANLLNRGLRANGFAATSTRERVSAFQAVVGTYLTTFQLLGALGLLLGILGLAIVILRGVWERLGELALLRAFGYTTRSLKILVLGENLVLLAAGILLGLVSAAISVSPHIALGGQLPLVGISVMIGAVFVVGIITVLLATNSVARIPILTALRKE